MNAFKFLDDVVKGTVLFIFSFFETTATMIVHPLRGSLRIYSAYRKHHERQISSITYLAIATGVTAAYTQLSPFAGPGTREFTLAAATMAATGTTSGGFVSFIGGALAGAILISGLLRLAARFCRRSPKRRERLTTTMEYQFGLLVLGETAFFALIDAASLPSMGVATEAVLLAGSVLCAIVPAWATAILLVVGLSKKPRNLIAYRNLERARFTPLRSKGEALLNSVRSRIRCWRHNLWQNWESNVGVPGDFLLAGFFCLVAVLSGVRAASEVSYWLRSQEHRHPIQLVEFSCNVLSDAPTITAVAWNRSERPVVNWLSDIAPVLNDGKNRIRLPWIARFTETRTSDLLAPKEAVELQGPIAVHGLRKRAEQMNYPVCISGKSLGQVAPVRLMIPIGSIDAFLDP